MVLLVRWCLGILGGVFVKESVNPVATGVGFVDEVECGVGVLGLYFWRAC